MPAHKHAELMRLYAEDALETDKPWELWEWRRPGETWQVFINDEDVPCWYLDIEYRRKPRTTTINGRELVAPERVAPAGGTRYWYPALLNYKRRDSVVWGDSHWDRTLLKRGLVFLREEDAVAMAEALLSLLKGEGNET